MRPLMPVFYNQLYSFDEVNFLLDKQWAIDGNIGGLLLGVSHEEAVIVAVGSRPADRRVSLRQGQRGSRRCVLLVHVVGFDDFHLP